jgi:hypothetical protein
MPAEEGPPFVVVTRAGDQIARWPLERPPRLDLTVIDELARMRLDARRAGMGLHVHRPCQELRELLGLVGLTELLEPD